MDKKSTHIHFMGIGGSGASAVAQIARGQGYGVSGCDLEEGSTTHRLRKDGIPVEIGHDPSHLKGVDVLAHTPAVFYQSQTHLEYTLAVKRKMAMTWEEFMAKELQKDKFVIAVAGTHGKGTTGAMLAYILEKAGLDPTVELGANLLDWGRKNYRVGKINYFICEADEFKDNFLVFKPNLAIITSIEMDHPEYFKNYEVVLQSFEKFTQKLIGEKMLVLNKDDEGCQQLSRLYKGKIIWYGGEYKGKLRLPGRHIRQDAQGAATAAKVLGVKEIYIKKALEKFSGLERRFEFKGQTEEGARVYDDYAHHPTAVRANIQGARELFPKKKLWVVFQPHMHTRLKVLFAEFANSLRLADRIIVTDVYTRRESGVDRPTGKELAIAVGPKATYVGGDSVSVANFVSRNSKKGDIIAVMGAGDSYKIAGELVK